MSGDLHVRSALRGTVFCEPLLNAVQHSSLTSLLLGSAGPAPKCALMVLQLSQALKQMERGNMLEFVYKDQWADLGVQDVHGQAAFNRFQAALQGCGL